MQRSLMWKQLFLYGNLEEEIYMERPPGLEHEVDECLLLNQSLYDLVQAARQYYMKFTGVDKKLDFVGGKVDPCLRMRMHNQDAVALSIHVDNSLAIGKNEHIQQAIEDLEHSGFKLKVEGELDDYLSCKITFDEDGKGAYIHQPHLLMKLKKKFELLINLSKKYTTPGTPSTHVMKSEEEKLNEKEHALYQSGVGMLLYLVKHTQPDIVNAVQELSKVLDEPRKMAWKEFLQDTKYVLDTRIWRYRLILRLKV